MFEILFLSVFGYKNGQLAKVKGQKPFAWVIYTIIAYISAYLVGMVVVVFGFCANLIDINKLSSTDTKVRIAASQEIAQAISNDFLRYITIQLFAIGGYLLVRYLLERKPGKKEPEVHWMDKIGEGE